MPDKETIQRVKRDKAQGKSPSTQAGEFVREEIEHIREGQHGARSAKQAIAIGLSKARRAGIDLKVPRKGTVSEKTRRSAILASRKGKKHEPISKKRSEASEKALKREGNQSVSHLALSRQAHAAARKRSASDRYASARSAARTKKAASK